MFWPNLCVRGWCSGSFRSQMSVCALEEHVLVAAETTLHVTLSSGVEDLVL